MPDAFSDPSFYLPAAAVIGITLTYAGEFAINFIKIITED